MATILQDMADAKQPCPSNFASLKHLTPLFPEKLQIYTNDILNLQHLQLSILYNISARLDIGSKSYCFSTLFFIIKYFLHAKIFSKVEGLSANLCTRGGKGVKGGVESPSYSQHIHVGAW